MLVCGTFVEEAFSHHFLFLILVFMSIQLTCLLIMVSVSVLFHSGCLSDYVVVNYIRVCGVPPLSHPSASAFLW